MAQGTESHDGQAPFARLKADVGAVEMKPQRGVESQAGIAANDQQQLVERRDRAGSSGPSRSSRPRSTTQPMRAAASGCERSRPCDDLADPVNSGDTDRPEPPFGLAELIRQAQIPAVGQKNVLMATPPIRVWPV